VELDAHSHGALRPAVQPLHYDKGYQNLALKNYEDYWALMLFELYAELYKEHN
jgi:hypothetical protein